MDIRIREQTVEDTQCDALVIGASYKKVGQQARELVLVGTAKEVDSLLGGLIRSIYDDGEFKANLGELMTLHPMGKLAAKRVVVVGLGAQEKMNTQTIRRASAIAARHLQQTGAHQIVLALNSREFNIDLDESVREHYWGCILLKSISNQIRTEMAGVLPGSISWRLMLTRIGSIRPKIMVLPLPKLQTLPAIS